MNKTMKSPSELMLAMMHANARRQARREIAKCTALCDSIDDAIASLKATHGTRAPVSRYLQPIE